MPHLQANIVNWGIQHQETMLTESVQRRASSRDALASDAVLSGVTAKQVGESRNV